MLYKIKFFKKFSIRDNKTQYIFIEIGKTFSIPYNYQIFNLIEKIINFYLLTHIK